MWPGPQPPRLVVFAMGNVAACHEAAGDYARALAVHTRRLRVARGLPDRSLQLQVPTLPHP